MNATVGKLTIQGTTDLKAIRRIGKAEDYTIRPAGEDADPKSGIGPEQIRVVLSGLALLAGFAARSLVAAPASVFVPLYVAAILSGAWGNARKAYYALPRFDFNMSVLMSTAVVGAVAIGQWEEAAVVSFLYAVSEMLEASTMERARRSIRDLMDIAPKRARIRRSSGDEEVSVDEIRIGDLMVIRPGEKIAMDGRIVTGESAINEAAITGESMPVEKGPNAEVFAGTLNTYGSLEVEVTKTATDTTIAKIVHLVEEAQSKRAPSQAFVDRFAAVYTPIVLALAAVLAFLPPLLFHGEWGSWIYRGLALLIVSCPCALVVSTPVAIVSAISNAAGQGVLIKGGVYLEKLGALSVIAFDKTGTLTKGRPVVTDLIPCASGSEDELLQTAVSIESHSEHPLGKAIVAAAESRHVRPLPAEGFTALPGRGAEGRLAGQAVVIGNLRLFEERGIPTASVSGRVRRLQTEGKTAVIVRIGESYMGIIAVADEVRETSRESVAALKRLGIQRTVMLTGDNKQTARAIAEGIEIDEVRAELLPEQKVKAIQTIMERHGEAAMVGDGINDAPALATATVGVAMGGAGTDTALETADIALMADDLSKLPYTIGLSRSALRIIKQNIGISLFVKLVAVAAVFPGWLTLWLAVLADMGTTLIVTLNGIRLVRFKSSR